MEKGIPLIVAGVIIVVVMLYAFYSFGGGSNTPVRSGSNSISQTAGSSGGSSESFTLTRAGTAVTPDTVTMYSGDNVTLNIIDQGMSSLQGFGSVPPVLTFNYVLVKTTSSYTDTEVTFHFIAPAPGNYTVTYIPPVSGENNGAQINFVVKASQ